MRQAKDWLGLQDSNLGMPVPKTGALPLGEAPTYPHFNRCGYKVSITKQALRSSQAVSCPA